MLKQNLTRLILVAMLSSVATVAFADDAAPVYDVDNYPAVFDGEPDDGSGAGTSATNGSVTTNPIAPAPSQSSYAPSQSLTTEQRISRAEAQISNLQSKDVSSKVETLQNEVQSLRGQVDQLNHQIQQLQNQQRAQYSDLDKRISNNQSMSKKKDQTAVPDDTIQNDTLSPPPAGQTVAPVAATSKPKSKSMQATANPVKIKTKTKVVTQTTTETSTPPAQAASAPVKSNDQQPNVAEEQQIYQTAYDLIKAKKYNEAINALQKMLQKYPSGQFAANAHYWLGELYGLLGKNDQSAVEFGAVVKNYPDSPKVADAQLKLGLIYAAQFKWSDAKLSFKKVINHYPGTASARLAAEQLKQIKEAGH